MNLRHNRVPHVLMWVYSLFISVFFFFFCILSYPKKYYDYKVYPNDSKLQISKDISLLHNYNSSHKTL